MDIAPISIEKNNISSLDCNMPTYGSHTFLFFIENDSIFLKYGTYPMVSVAVGANLLAGTNCPYEIYIVPSANSGEQITPDNISEFYIGMVEK